MRKIVVLAPISLLFILPVAARAEIGIPDTVPAATLLLPRFEVELEGGITTLFAINNASPDVVLAHLTVWSEWWVPVVGFDVYLTGYDVQTFNLRDLIVNGDLPNTGPSNVLSSLGEFSDGPHTTFGGTCSSSPGSAPNYASISGAFLQVIRQSLSGEPRSSDGLCASSPEVTGLARGFVTIDVVRGCENAHPSASGYFVDGGLGIATNENVLWGDFFIVDAVNNFAQGWALVHLEADGFSLGVDDGACDTIDRHPTTFYCTIRSPLGEPGEDNREGLPSAYATRYLAGGAFTGGTDLVVWRDKNGTGVGAPRACDDPPAPLQQNQIVVFDEQENPVTEGLGPVGDPVEQPDPFPFATNRAHVGTHVTIDAPFGWLFLNLNDDSAAQDFRQAYVMAMMSALERFSVGVDAIALNSLTLGADNRRGPRDPDPILPSSGPTLFDGTLPP